MKLNPPMNTSMPPQPLLMRGISTVTGYSAVLRQRPEKLPPA